MKRIIVLLIFTTLTQVALSQFSYDKLLIKKRYSKIQKKIVKRYKKSPDDVSVNFDFSVLYSLHEFKLVNIDTAYVYAKEAENLYSFSDKKEKLNKKSLNKETIHNQVLLVCKLAFDRSVEKNNVESYNDFLKRFPEDQLLIEKAVKNRNKVAFDYAKNINTVQSFQNFIDIYPKANEINQAKKMRNSLAFLLAKEENTTTSYQQFIDIYPFADDVALATDLRDQLAYDQANDEKSASAFDGFIRKYPKSKLISKAIYERDKYSYLENIKNNVLSHIRFLDDFPNNKYRDIIADTLFYISQRTGNLQGLHYLIENHSNSKLVDSIWHYYYKMFTHDGYTSTYETFAKLYQDRFPYREILQKEYLTSLLVSDLELEEGYQKKLAGKYKEYISQAYDKYSSFQVLQIILKPLIDKKDWKGTLDVIQEYKPYFGTLNKNVNNLEEIITYSDKNISIKNIGSVINTKKGGEYVPVISADNKYLYFCGKDRPDNYSGEDIFVSENKNGRWQKPVLISELCTYGNDAPLSISTDGNKLFAFKNGDLYYSDRTYSGWSELEAFPRTINSKEWDADAMISSDGNAILFSSQRKDVNKGTGLDLISTDNIDIYVSLRTEDGWSFPINLGHKINTRYNDRSPYLHSDMKTLYFSSNGHGGLGELDVFKSTRLSDTSWTEWSEPINMGKEINSSNADWGYKISTDGKLAYFAGINNGNNDIFTVELPLYLRPGLVATISGKLLGKNNEPIESTIKWEDLEKGKIVGESKSNPKDGSFFIVLPLGKVYGYFIDKNKYYPISNNIDLRTEEEPVEVENDIEMVTFKQMIDDGLAVPINNLFFPINKDKILPESVSELKRVAEIIKANNLKVEISGHTDNTGENIYNQELSEKRAIAVRDYLVSLDVSDELISIVGHGSKKPVANNKTEAGQAKNRRVELKFI